MPPKSPNTASNIPKSTSSRPKSTSKSTDSLPTKPNSSSIFLQVAKAYHFPPIDITDDKAVEQRIKAYLNSCFKDNAIPTLSGLCTSLHISRHILFKWINGKLPNTNPDLVIRAKSSIEMFLEVGMIDKSINPVVGIFLLKNDHGYSDTTPGFGEGEEVDTQKTAEELIAESYLLPDQTPVDVVPHGDGSVE